MSRQLRRLTLWALTLILAVGITGAAQAQAVVMNSPILMPPVPLADSPAGVVVFSLSWMADAKGEGKGTLNLDPNRRTLNEFGDPVSTTDIAEKSLEVSLKYIKTGKVKAGPPGLETDWFLYEITGAKLATKLFLAVPDKKFQYGRLLVHDKNGQVAFVVGMREMDKQPCHPGCFPAGTAVLTPLGNKPIETIKVGDAVSTVGTNGMSATGKVQSIFVTHNRLLQVQTEAGPLLTTQTQPLCLPEGEFRAAAELKVGDMVFCWKDGKRQAVKVLKVTLTEQDAKVFNLVLGEDVVFIAGGFLVRSKPPGAIVLSASPAPAVGPALPPNKK